MEKLPLKPTATDQSSNYPVLFSILQTNIDLKVAITNYLVNDIILYTVKT